MCEYLINNMTHTIETLKELIKEHLNHNVISTIYSGKDTVLDIECHCGEIYQNKCSTILNGIKKGYKYHCDRKRIILTNISCKRCGISFKPIKSRIIFCSRKCSAPRSIECRQNISNTNKQLQDKTCKFCNIQFRPKRMKTLYCSKKCAANYNKTNIEFMERARHNGQIGGRISAKSQQRRSKNEIFFAELCEDFFGKDDIQCNNPIFQGWDADVIILSKKMAVLWNGQWHYKQIMKSQSLAQVQSRDKIKYDTIIRCGYTPFIIKDMGKYNPSFVKQEFECFLLCMIDML